MSRGLIIQRSRHHVVDNVLLSLPLFPEADMYSVCSSRISPVFVLHFVEGLPDNDLCVYSFTFQQQEYSVTTVIQYDQQLKHFVTWIRRTDGSWLEFDDLKHPNCVSHTQLVVPPREIHVVFWDVLHGVPVQSCYHNLSLPLHNDTAVVEALTVSDDTDIMDATVTTGKAGNSSISTTLLDTFEGLSHDDVVTLTLVEAPTPPSPPPHSKPATTSTSLQSKPGLPPPPDPNSRWSYLLSLHPTSIPNPPRPTSHFKHSTPNRFQQLSHSWQTPSMAPPNPDARLKKPPPPPLPKPKLSKVDNEALPVKAAEMYGGFQARSRIININMNSPSKTSSPTQLLSQRTDPQNGAWKIPSQPPALVLRKPLINHTTSTMLGYQGGAGGLGEVTCTPDITDRSPSHTVSSSTSVYDSPAYDQFFADLLSPATTASNLSPDSTGLLEMLTTNGQEGGGDLACGGNGISGASQVVTPVILHPANHGVVVPQPAYHDLW
ncbi:unnamed protein product [Oncorhynchus mykiss]|uniref:Ubiquitin-specific peptidase-like SUMO isopeptidase domain-containing protein n=1 Tax=Oncorhynchus mykiss TaxID=8022 RepID=A0A060XNM9_ONCMY|nr:unnamed protein product [Oncorhynchus mykiss]